MVHTTTLPGFFATNSCARPRTDGSAAVVGHRSGAINLWYWQTQVEENDGLTFTLSRVARETAGEIPSGRVAKLLRLMPHVLTELQPPFAAVGATDDDVTMVADSMGFQPLYHTESGTAGPQFMSSSSLAAAQAIDAALDETAIAVQSLLGWQLGQRTLFRSVRKLEPGAVARLGTAGVVVNPGRQLDQPISFSNAVAEAAALLRLSLNSLLDDHPDAVLQLTGGMDSRLLLSAIPESRRRGLRAMTLEVPGGGDVSIARALAERYGIKHYVHGLADVGQIEPREAWERCVSESNRLDAMADPVALAAQRIAEQAFDQGVRISGLGGEVARGFYYLGKVRDRTYSRDEVDRLASWRMFVNDAVQTDLLTAEFAGWARQEANDQVYAAMRAGGDEWFRAADHMYLRDRMQRWAGATDIAVSDQRVVINPMLDAKFLSIAARLSPSDKARSKFLAALQMELDPELGRIPLDGRPAPAVYADPPDWQPALDAISLGKRALRKGVQRLRRDNRPPAGGTVMAGKVVEWWRERPTLLEPLDSLGFIRNEWLNQVVAGEIDPRPSSVAFLTNLLVATAETQIA